MPPFSGHFDLLDMVRRLDGVVSLVNASLSTLRTCSQHNSTGGMQLSWIRVPLDFRRSGMVSLQWRNYLLSELVVSANLDLLMQMGLIHRLLVRSTKTMPLEHTLQAVADDACRGVRWP